MARAFRLMTVAAFAGVWPQLALAQVQPSVPVQPTIPGMTAQVTDVADAADPGNVIDFNAQVGFSRTQRNARITRENVVNGRQQFANELSYSQVQNQLDIKAQLSLYHDLELNFYMPYIFNQDASWGYASGVSTANSSITTDPTTGGPLFAVPYHSYKRGLDHADFGIAWSPFNDTRDDTKPTWTLRLTYGAPLGAAYKPVRDANNPSNDAQLANSAANGRNASQPAGLSDRTHQIKMETDLSKRMGYLEPYVTVKLMVPIVDGSGIKNLQPPITGGLSSGFEIVPWENVKERQRLSLDFRGSFTYIGPGRYYTEVTDPLRQITFMENYANFTGGFHLLLQAVEYVRFTAGVTFGYDTSHILTNENVGNDVNGDGVVDLNDPKERNPLYNSSVDAIGHRLRVEASTVFNFYVTLAITL